jgi:hypothetical protein
MKRINIIGFLFLLLFVCSPCVFGQQIQKIEAEGFGWDRNMENAKKEAIKGAMSSAVEEAVNRLVSPEIVERNFRSIKDNIYKDPNLYIKNYVIQEEDKFLPGFKVIIRADVAMDDLKRDLQKNISKIPLKSQAALLQSFIDVFENESFTRNRWYLAFEALKDSHKPKRKDEVLLDFDKWLQKKPEKVKKTGQLTEYKLALKNKGYIKNFLDSLGSMGSDLAYFLYDPAIGGPVCFAQKENEIALIIAKVATSTVYNTLRTTPRARAAQVMGSKIIPTMKNFDKSFKGADIKYFGLAVTYGSKDFSDKLSQKAEMVGFVFSAENCRKFAESTITEDQLVDSSKVFLSDRDMSTGIKKIKIVIE